MPKVRYSGVIRLIKILCHAGLVLFLSGFPVLLYFQTKKAVKPYGNPLESPFYWLFVISFVSFFYGYTYYLIPRLLLKKKYAAFLGIVFLIFIGFYLVKPSELFFSKVLIPLQGLESRPADPLSLDFITFIIFFMMVATGLAIQVVRQWRLSERRALQAETDKANAELSFLKAQINPHFLFNTLNNIYSLSVRQNPVAPASIMKLSNIMRYVTEEATNNYVSLESEVLCISDYIDLQRLRHAANVTLDFSVTGNIRHKRIAPLILLTYIENVFKYGISSHEPALITIKLFSDEQKITFFCQNKIFSTPRVTERTGIGLVNTKKRLEHLYPDKHTLSITNENGLYTVALALQA
jgi:two-component system LytT family sensor kinase